MNNGQLITASLQSTANACFMNGFSSTDFMREIHRHPDCSILLQEEIMDCYHTESEPEMLELIFALGYEDTPFGFFRA
jgi:hypothetical protein